MPDVDSREVPGSTTRTAGRLGLLFVVDDEPIVRMALSRALEAAGYRVESFDRVESVLDALEVRAPRVQAVIADVVMPGKSGLDLLAEARTRWPELPILIITGQGTVTAAVEAMRLGAYDYLLKPIDTRHTLLPAVQRALERRRLLERNRFLESRLQATDRAAGLVGESAVMRHVCSLISAAAPTDTTVIILGESGTGKELVARAIHDQSPRGSRMFVDVNCAALTDSLLESELFGHVKGAFTGATATRAGLFETASGGTLFLDEVGELAPTIQARLLRVLQENVVRPLGSSESKPVDVRVIAATNRNLAAEVEAGRFRRDLFYRLNVFNIEIAPLRERLEDVPPLVEHFLTKHSRRMNRPRPHVDPNVLDVLMAHPWHGNVRELENTIERALILCRSDTITVDLLPRSMRAQSLRDPVQPERNGAIPSLADARRDFLRSYVRRVLASTRGHITEAARVAGMDPSNFRKLVRRLDKDMPEDGNGS